MFVRPVREVLCAEYDANIEPRVQSGKNRYDTLCTPSWSSALSDKTRSHFLQLLFVLSDVSNHFILENFPHSLFDLLEKDLRNPTAQGVDCVQELCLDGVEQRLEHVVLEGKLQEQRHCPVSVLIPKLFQLDGFF